MSEKKFVLWLTGLSGAGKTTLAREINKRLKELEIKSHHLDGDEVRAASQEKLDFSCEGRDKNIQLAIDMAAEYNNQGYIVVASFISPYEKHRQWGREKLENYIEVFVDASLELCESRDTKGMYKKARNGEIEFFTGIGDSYEPPAQPHVHLKTGEKSIEECLAEIENYLTSNNLI